MLKRIFHVGASVLMLALAYHLGATSATAQTPGNPVPGASHDASDANSVVITSNGDVYSADRSHIFGGQWTYRGNVFSGPTPAQRPTWGSLKVRYR